VGGLEIDVRTGATYDDDVETAVVFNKLFVESYFRNFVSFL